MDKNERKKLGAMGWSLALLKEACKLIKTITEDYDAVYETDWILDAEKLLKEVEDSMLVSVK